MRSKADETLVIVETLICPLQISDLSNLCNILSAFQNLMNFYSFFYFNDIRP